MAVQKSAKQTTPAKKAPAKAVKPAKKVAKAAPAKKTGTAAKTAAKQVTKVTKVAKPPARPVATKPKAPAVSAAPARATAKKAAKATPAPVATSPAGPPAVKGTTKDGIAYTKDFDVKFLSVQRAALLQQRAELVGQANRLEDEANSLIEEQEMGDVEFGDEGGEGDTMVVERERDLALSAQARQTVDDIDAALARLAEGTYGYSLSSWRPIPRERLEAIPWATALVEEKVGGLGRR